MPIPGKHSLLACGFRSKQNKTSSLCVWKGRSSEAQRDHGIGLFALFAAVRFLNLSQERKAGVLWLALLELIISLQNFQSNGLVAALILGTFVAFEAGWPEAAALCVALGGTIKIFGAAAGLLFIFYPRKIRFLLALITAAVVLAALPLIVIPLAQLHARGSRRRGAEWDASEPLATREVPGPDALDDRERRLTPQLEARITRVRRICAASSRSGHRAGRPRPLRQV